MKYFWSLIFLSLMAFSCSEQKTEMVETVDAYANISSEMKGVLEAHGGLGQWSNMKALTYEFARGDRSEIHKIDLETRKVLLEGGEWKIGFDGSEVWVSPDKETYGGNSARFYHNLLFYFYAMPFVLADPGINYKNLEPKEIQGKKLNRISITYGSGVGDAPDDEYIICYDPESNQMEWLFYTVTYFSKEKGKKYNALHYDGWKETSTLLLPETMTGYKTSGDTITEKRYENLFKNVQLTAEPFDPAIFEMPEVAEIDSLN